MLPKYKYWFLSIFYFQSSFLFANCPAPPSIIYHCNDTACTWAPKGGWYEGSSDYSPNLKRGDRLDPGSFEKTIWFPSDNDAYGTTLCYYRGPIGELITLFQQTKRNEVAKPTGENWYATSDPDYIGGIECIENTESCAFDFGEKW